MCNKQAERTHRAWLIEMTRNARAVTHADVDRQEQRQPQLPEEEMQNSKLKVMAKRSEDAQNEHKQALQSYMMSLTTPIQTTHISGRFLQRGGGGGAGVPNGAAVLDSSVYLERAKQLRLNQNKQKKTAEFKDEQQRRFEHDHGKNPHSPTLKRVGVIKKKNTALYFPIGSQGKK